MDNYPPQQRAAIMLKVHEINSIIATQREL